MTIDLIYVVFDIEFYRPYGQEPYRVHKCFLQKSGNRKELDKLKEIFDMYKTELINVRFYDKKYTLDEVKNLRKYDCLWTMFYTKTYEVSILSGRLKIPGKMEEYEKVDMTDWIFENFSTFMEQSSIIASTNKKN